MTGDFQGALSESRGQPIEIEGLWGLAFGNGVTAGSETTLYYAAGPEDETHGLFGKITANPEGTSPVEAVLMNDNLVITGSRNNDHVTVEMDRTGQQIVVSSRHNRIGTFDLASVDVIRFNGLAGNDHIHVSRRIHVTTILNGGADDDMLVGGGGNNIMLGETGRDHMLGRGDRNILIGGDDRDFLVKSGSDDDLLIGGSTAHDSNSMALLQILAEWTSTDPYTTRVNNLRNGAGGLPMLDATTVFDDGMRDLMLGGRGHDWFFTGMGDLLLGKRSNEEVY